MKIKIKGNSFNPNSWKVFFDNKQVENLISIKFNVEANSSPVISFEAYAKDIEVDLENISIFTTTEKEIKNKIEELFLQIVKG